MQQKFLNFFLFLLCFFFTSPIIGQKENSNLKQKNQIKSYKKLIKSTNQIDSSIFYQKKILALSIKINDSTNIGNAHIDLANFYRKKENIPLSIYHFEKGIPILKSKTKLKSANRSSYYLGILYRQMGDFEASSRVLENAIQYFIEKKDSSILANFYNALANTTQSFGDFGRALDFHFKSLELRKKLGNKRRIGVAYNNMANCYLGLDQKNEAKKCLDKSIKLFQEVEQWKGLGTSYGILSRINFEEKNCEKALEFAILSLENFKKNKNELNRKTFQIWSYHDLSQAYKCQNKLDNSKNALNNSITLSDEIGYLSAQVYGRVLQTLLALKEKKYEEGFPIIQKALTLISNEDLIELNQNPKLENIEVNRNSISVLQLKGELFLEQYFNQKQDLDNLKQGFGTFLLGIDLIEKLKLKYVESSSKEELQAAYIAVFEGAIASAYELFKLSKDKKYLLKILELSEKSKAVLLFQALKEGNAKKFANIPDSLIHLENKINSEINYNEQKIFNLKNNTNAEREIFDLKEKTFELKNRKKHLLTYLEENFEKYYRIKYESKLPKLNEIQKNLKKEEAIVEYFIGEKRHFAILILKNDFQVYPIKIEHLEEKISELRFSISAPWSNDISVNKNIFYKEYTKSAFEIYRKIWNLFDSKIKNNINNIIIIPDGVLGYLPFEILLSDSVVNSKNFKTHPYLIKNYNYSYAYSIASLLELNAQKNKPSKQLIAFAPFTESPNILAENQQRNYILNPLIWSKKETENIRKIWNGESYFGRQANASKFIQNVADYQIVHLATHAKANDQNIRKTGILLANDTDSTQFRLINIADIYNLKLNAEMVVLSACETALGKLKRGEGIISLARAFTFAGSKNIITTLWSIEDQASGKIMEKFYFNLKGKQAKDVSLRKAKLDYLAEQDHQFAHPYFWAGIISVGDNSALKKRSLSPFWALGLVFVSLFFVFIFRKTYLLKLLFVRFFNKNLK